MSSLVVLEPGAATTLQDGGRRGLARYGVPRSGPVDALAHRLAARLAGARAVDVPSTAAIEVGPDPCTLQAQDGPVTLAVAGADVTVRRAGTATPAPCVVPLEPGERCTVTAPTWGYVVPGGGVNVPAVLGSRSRHPRSGLGPELVAASVLHVGPGRQLRVGRRPAPSMPGGPLRLLAAPQTDHFTEEALQRLTGEEYRTTTAFDRMAHRLDGPELATRDGHDIVSDGIVAGTLQVPGDGRAWVLTADHQTTGGYPKVAVLATADLARFVRLAPGTPVRFAWTDVATARTRLQDALAAIEEVVTGPVTPLATTLASSNLIDGVSDGTSVGNRSSSP